MADLALTVEDVGDALTVVVAETGDTIALTVQDAGVAVTVPVTEDVDEVVVSVSDTDAPTLAMLVLLDARTDALAAADGVTDARLAAHETALAEHETRLGGLDATVGALSATLDGVSAAVAETLPTLATSAATSAALAAAVGTLEAADASEAMARIAADSAEASARAAADTALGTRVGALETAPAVTAASIGAATTTALTAAVQGEADTRAAADTALASALAAKADATALAAEASTRAAADTALGARIDTADATLAAKADAATVTALDGRVTVAESTLAAKADASALDAYATDAELAAGLAALAATIPAPVEGTASYVIAGGQVAQVANYQYRVSAARYYLQGTQHTSAETVVTLGAADATQDRIDVVAVDDTGAVVVVPGTPAGDPVQPTTDALMQLPLTFVLVTHATAAPPGAVVTPIYREHAGTGGGEWAVTTASGAVNLDSATDPYAGAKNIAFAAAGSGAGFTATPPTPRTLDGATLLPFQIRSGGAWPAKRSMSLWWRSASGARVGSVVTLAEGAYGFASANTAAWQQVAIPVSDFRVPTGTSVTDLRVEVAGATGSLTFRLDQLELQGSTGSTPAPAASTPRATATTTGTVRTDVTEADPLVYAKATTDTLLAGKASAGDPRLSDARPPAGTAGGDLAGAYPDPSVAKIDGVPVDLTTPTAGQRLAYDGTSVVNRHEWQSVVLQWGDGVTAGSANMVARAALSFAGEVVGWKLEADAACSCTVALSKAALGGAASSLTTGGTAPALASATEASDTDGTTGWGASGQFPAFATISGTLTAYTPGTSKLVVLTLFIRRTT